MISQSDSTADNTPDVVKDPDGDNPEHGGAPLATNALAATEETEPAAEIEEEAATEETNEVTDDAGETDTAETNDADESDEDGPDEELEEVAETDDETSSADDDSADDESADEETVSAEEESDEPKKQWYILKVQVNRETSIRDALERRTKIEGLEEYFGEIVVPTEEVAEFNRAGKRRIVKKKLFPGYIMAHMIINDDTWFLVRETPGIGDFTGSAGKPTPMDQQEVDRILQTGEDVEDSDQQVKTAIPFKTGDRVRVKDGYFLNFEGEVEGIDEANGRVTVMINIFGRSTPVELEHWQIEDL